MVKSYQNSAFFFSFSTNKNFKMQFLCHHWMYSKWAKDLQQARSESLHNQTGSSSFTLCKSLINAAILRKSELWINSAAAAAGPRKLGAAVEASDLIGAQGDVWLKLSGPAENACGDFLSSLLHHGQKFARSALPGKRSRPLLALTFDHYLFSTLEVYEWRAGDV